MPSKRRKNGTNTEDGDAVDDRALDSAVGGVAWEKHLAAIKPELRVMDQPFVDIRAGESINGFCGADALIDEIERKREPVHIVVRYLNSDIVVQFHTDFVAGKFQMPVLRFHCYTPDAKVADSAMLRVVFNCTDDERNAQSVECVVARISQWPGDQKIIYDVKTAHPSYNVASVDEFPFGELQLNLHLFAMNALAANYCPFPGWVYGAQGPEALNVEQVSSNQKCS